MNGLRFSKLVASLVLLALAISLFPSISPANAQSLSTAEVIAAVNALRASRGLAAYQVDTSMMAYAQEHANYMASIDMATHQRPDGSTSWSVGIEENIATGTNGMLTVDMIMNDIWSDAIHMKTMVSFSGGSIGAGIALKGNQLYISIDVRPVGTAGPIPLVTSKPSTPGAAATKSIPLESLVTVTPRPDGAVVHKVGYGQTLWNIALAYGVKIDDIRRLNGLDPNSNNIYDGWKLIIRPASPENATLAAKAAITAATPTTGDTPAPAAPTKTRVPPSATVKPPAAVIPSPTPTPTSKPIQLESFLPDRKITALILILICAAGLGIVVVSSFRRSA
jgi:LysM repeat protein